MRLYSFLIFVCLFFVGFKGFSEEKRKPEFSDKVKLECTSVKSQGNTGTCWSFAMTSFLESELMRMGKGAFDLSEMFFVEKAYKDKARLFLLYQGNNNFTEGGQAHDVLNVIREYGLVPDTVLPGEKTDGKFQHRELVKELEEVVRKSNKWKKDFDATDTKSLDPVLEKNIGKNADSFNYEGKDYTPESFRSYLGINPDDYIELTSYSHHPFYKPFILEVPDNWSHDEYYNLPINELMEVIDSSLVNGYTVCWDGDTSEKHFTAKKGKADLPEDEIGKVDQELRQKTFFNRRTTDDHLMHLVGIATDENGREFFNTKNSWGAESNDYQGFLYMSDDYVRLKTIAVLVNRKAIPSEIATKLNLK
jgi:bleomycin hydrolase